MKLIKLPSTILILTYLLVGSNSMAIENVHQELVVIDIPDHNVEKKTIHFSQALSLQTMLPIGSGGYTSVSDEYWFEVTGKELNQGIDFSTSHPGALIRLSSQKIKNKLLPTDLAIAPYDIEIFSGGSKHQNLTKFSTPFQQSISQDKLATANIFPNSSAMKLSDEIGLGNFKLKVRKALMKNQRYIVNVKEKSSKYKLNLSTSSQSYSAGELVSFEASMMHDSRALNNGSHTAFIKMPSGERKSVDLIKYNNTYQVKVPEDFQRGRTGELYELHLESKALDNKIMVQRNGKFAFAIAQPTAQITGKLVVQEDAALIDLNIASEGRYEISGIIYGSNKKGELTQIMLSRSAYYLLPGKQKVELRFDNEILRKSGVKSSYSIKGVKVIDQSRMVLLQQL